MTLKGYLGYRFQETFKISMLGSGKEDHNQSQLFNKAEQHKVNIIHSTPESLQNRITQSEGGTRANTEESSKIRGLVGLK